MFLSGGSNQQPKRKYTHTLLLWNHLGYSTPRKVGDFNTIIGVSFWLQSIIDCCSFLFICIRKRKSKSHFQKKNGRRRSEKKMNHSMNFTCTVQFLWKDTECYKFSSSQKQRVAHFHSPLSKILSLHTVTYSHASREVDNSTTTSSCALSRLRKEQQQVEDAGSYDPPVRCNMRWWFQFCES